MGSPLEQITHQEVDGDIMPPDPAVLPKDDVNAPSFIPFRNRDKLPADAAPDAEILGPAAAPAAEVGIFATSSTKPEIPEDLRQMIDTHRAEKAAAEAEGRMPTDNRHITLFSRSGPGRPKRK